MLVLSYISNECTEQFTTWVAPEIWLSGPSGGSDNFQKISIFQYDFFSIILFSTVYNYLDI